MVCAWKSQNLRAGGIEIRVQAQSQLRNEFEDNLSWMRSYLKSK